MTDRVRDLVITADFLSSAYALSKDKRSKLIKTLNLFARNPDHPGLNREIVTGTVVERLQSIRVDLESRIVLCDLETPVLLYAGAHDDAYRFARGFRQLQYIRPLVTSTLSRTLPTRTFEELMTRGRKYVPLSAFLLSRTEDEITLGFEKIEEIIAAALPHSARTYAAWWANDPTHVQARGWLEVGWKTARLQLESGRVTFGKSEAKPS